MEDLTTEFRKYDLKEIVREYQESLNSNDEGDLLPEYVGGSNVKLLIGIKNTNLVPVLIKTLKSGVGVYRRPFKDIIGSRIIFAGPHAAITGNRGGDFLCSVPHKPPSGVYPRRISDTIPYCGRQENGSRCISNSSEQNRL